MKTIAALVFVLALAGCATSPDALGAAVNAARMGEAIYCNGITEEARQATRDALTGGVKVLNCPPLEKPKPDG